jgi:hypothetical protein
MNPKIVAAADFANELAEVLELKLLGSDTVGEKPWNEYAYQVLANYHKAVDKTVVPYRPLWRSLYEAYSSIEKTNPPYFIFSRIITAFCDRIESDFPVHEIDRSILLGYLRDESEKALSCE